MNFDTALKELSMAVKEERPADEKPIITVINKAKDDGLSVKEIADLAELYASSGDEVSFDSAAKLISNIASTGGTSSLSTLLCPLYLTLLGSNVVKVGVPGRPAGGIDVLAQIEGYKSKLSASEIHSAIKKCGYAHFNAGSFARLDATMFKYRQDNGAQAVPDLVIASLLGKKLCVGVNLIGLDVRVSPFGNFGETFEVARKNSKKFCEVAYFLGKKASCFLTDGTRPYQPYIGRGEALVALNRIFSLDMDEVLLGHDLLCFRMASELLDLPCVSKPEGESLRLAFTQNIETQGGKMEVFYRIVENILEAHVYSILAERSGILEINLQSIRSTIVDTQREDANGEVFPDPCGVILKAKAGHYVRRNEELATFRASASKRDELAERFGKAFRICENQLDNHKARFEVVTNV